MGVFKMFSSCSGDSNSSTVTKVIERVVEKTLPNPNPRNFKIIRHTEVDINLVVEVEYPDATNYEGRKIMVYRGLSFADIRDVKFLDPHFCDHGNCISPFARFRPTESGWAAATALAKMI